MQRRQCTPRALTLMLAAAWALTGLVTLGAQGKDPFVGTWVLNVAKSSFAVPAAAYKSSTMQIETAGDGQKIDVDTAGPGGPPIRYSFTASFDGKDYPVPGIGTVTLKRVDPRTVERVHKTDGKPTMTILSRVSRDGKTLTLTQTGTGRAGEQVHNELVYEKK